MFEKRKRRRQLRARLRAAHQRLDNSLSALGEATILMNLAIRSVSDGDERAALRSAWDAVSGAAFPDYAAAISFRTGVASAVHHHPDPTVRRSAVIVLPTAEQRIKDCFNVFFEAEDLVETLIDRVRDPARRTALKDSWVVALGESYMVSDAMAAVAEVEALLQTQPFEPL